MCQWDRSEITEKVRISADNFGASDQRQIDELVRGCRESKEREVFFGLFTFFYDESIQQNQYDRQQLAGNILFSVLPRSPLALDGSVYAAAQFWNNCVKELPWYWCEVYGQKAVVGFLAELIPDCAEMKLRKTVEAMLTWCENYGQKTPNK
ncbi:MAG: hypothetical protein H6959_02330 [Chromatiaceae bacterium]|nr:hypothetical protein [Chromatiaceae bacterium]